MRQYSAIKRNEVLMHATAWMILKHIMLSDRSQKLTPYINIIIPLI